MAAFTLPTLSFAMRYSQAMSADTGAAFLTALGSDSGGYFPTYSQSWVKVSHGSGYLEIKPVSTDPGVTNMRIILHDGTLGTNLATTHMNTTGGNHRIRSAGVMVGFDPKGGLGTLGTVASSDPYGTGTFSGYTEWIPDVSDVDKFWIIESAETIALVGAGVSGTSVRPWIGGALIKAPDDAIFPSSNKRLFSIFSPGGDFLSGAFWNSAGTWPGTNTSNSKPKALVHHPDPDAWIAMERIGAFNIDDQNYLTDSNGAAIGLPFFFRYKASPYRFVGHGRQMSVTEDRAYRMTLSSGGEVKRVILGSDLGTNADAIGFDNT